jgi:hypothetical protein
MKKTNVLYWTFTGLFAFFMLGSAIPDMMIAPIAVQGFKEMGYPLYLIPFLGYAKLLGVIAILVPGFPKIREWAYAGLMFDLCGAVYSIIALGAPAAQWAPVFIPILFGILSYAWYQRRQKAQQYSLQFN